MNYVVSARAEEFLPRLKDGSVDLFVLDPPYFAPAGVSVPWKAEWRTPSEYCAWLLPLLAVARAKVAPTGSLILFQPLGRHGAHAIFQIAEALEKTWTYRNWITWARKRGWASESNYASCRDEILWFSASDTYAFNSVDANERALTNVWSDIEPHRRPERACQRPLPLIARVVRVHSNPGDLVVDCFAGWGTTGVAAHNLGRRYLGSEEIEVDAVAADHRVTEAKRPPR